MTSYADYVKKGNHFNPAYLAKEGALPKSSRTTSPKRRMWEKFDKEEAQASTKKTLVPTSQLMIPKNGYLVRIKK